MTFKPIKPYQPWYDDERDYNTNAPTYYDYLANSTKLEKVQTDAINELLVRDVNFKDSDEIHVDKLTNWHSDDNTQHGEITFKAHVITSPSSTTQTIDGTDYVASNAITVLHDGIYSPDYKKVLEKYSSDNNSKFTKLTSDVNTLNGNVKQINTNITSLNNSLEQAKSDINRKQNALTATGGVLLSGDTLSLDSIDGYKGDLNNLKTTRIVKTTQGATNLPTYTGIVPDGILNVTRLGDIVSQVYYPFNNIAMFVRSANNINKSNETWRPWRTIVDTEGLTEAIKNVNKANNLQNPDIYKFHKFSNVSTTVTGDWGFEFFNDTNSKIYNVKIKVGTIKEANTGTVIAQQNTSTLLQAGVPQDFITKATNGYVFRAGYYLGDSLNRIAFELKTESDKLNLKVKYYDTAGTINNTLVVQGHECAPIAVPYNSAVSIEETGQLKPVDDSTIE